jgi:hypothetical protein
LNEAKAHPAALPLARLRRAIRLAARQSRTRTNGSFEFMLSELESNAERLDGFADSLEAIVEEFGLTCEEEEGSLKSGKGSETE